jgi:predicted RND superfamily exporter protein
MEPLERFVNEVRSVDPEITGTPLQNFEAALQIKESYEVCAIYSLVVILLVLLIDFIPKEYVLSSFIPPAIALAVIVATLIYRKMEVPVLPMVLVYAAGVFVMAAWWHRAGVLDTVSAIVPPFLGLLLTFAVLAVLGIPLNPANLIILPLIIGIGVDNGVHVLHDFHGKPHEVYRPSASMVNAITMTSCTSICGFGSMMTSSHRGLYSLGAVLSIGVVSCVLMSLVTLPALLAWISRHRKPEEPSGEMASPSPPLPIEDEPRILPMPNASRVA